MTAIGDKWVSDCGSVTLFCGDCLSLLPTLPKVDAVVTDPPYGLGDKWKGGVLKRAPRSRLDPVFVDLVNGAAQKYGSDQSVIDNLWEEIK